MASWPALIAQMRGVSSSLSFLLRSSPRLMRSRTFSFEPYVIASRNESFLGAAATPCSARSFFCSALRPGGGLCPPNFAP